LLIESAEKTEETGIKDHVAASKKGHQVLHPLQSSPQLIRFCMKQCLGRKIRQQDRLTINLLTEKRLKENEGTHSTLVKIKDEERRTMCVTKALWPFGKLT
jgi:hypothetical protein